ncbi:MAG: ABC transporter substrate-binding protein [Nitrososphaerota archaeon]|nr:ABC transporter substrate-binding protein [Nitrososphaerota archaeon]
MKRNGVSTGGTIGVLIIGLLVGAGIVYAAAPSILPSQVTTVNGNSFCNGGTFTIGNLADTSGALSAQGIAQTNALTMAISDINAYSATTGCHVTFRLSSLDYAHDPTKAVQQVQAFNTAGVTAIVGPLDSDSLIAIQQTVNQDHIVTVSPSSTSAVIANRDPTTNYVFRTVPTDAYQAKADTAELLSQNVKDLIVINFYSSYAGALANATIADFTAAGGHVQDQIQYQITTTDFTPVLNQMISDWNSAIQTYQPNQVAIFAASEEEISSLLLQANASSTYSPLLHTPQPWYGVDGESQDTVISNSSIAGNLVAQVKLAATVYNAPSNQKLANFSARFQAAYNQAPPSYAQGAYDDAWLIALSALAAQSSSGSAMKAVLPSIANNLFGVTGWLVLGPHGDAYPTFGYQIWQVVHCTTSCPAGYIGTAPDVWVQVGTYDLSSNSVTWASPNYPQNP